MLGMEAKVLWEFLKASAFMVKVPPLNTKET